MRRLPWRGGRLFLGRPIGLYVGELLCGLAFAGFANSPCAAAPEHIENFDGEQTIATVSETGGAQVRSHRLDRNLRHGEGRSSEAFEIFSARPGGTFVFDIPLRPSRVFPELSSSIFVRSNRSGATTWLRVVFPNQKDPETGQALTMLVRGETYETSGKWQQLRCQTTDKRVQEQLVNERLRLREPNLNLADLYVDRLRIAVPVSVGPTEIYFDDLRFGPIVDPHPDKKIEQASNPREIQRAVELRLGRLEVHGRPFLGKIVPYHGERVDILRQTGFNVALIPRYDDAPLLAELRKHGLWAMAEPPCAMSEQGAILDARTAGILPFGEETSPILMWNIGTLVTKDKQSHVAAWTEQVRGADGALHRPIAADVSEHERVYSRIIELLSASRHVIGTTSTLADYRDWLIQKRRLANPGTFMWTWVQTEPVAANARWRDELKRAPIVVEPEQIRLQVYAALAAGCRAVGYWNRTPLDAEAPGAEERRHVLTMVNLELELLEPWLAAGSVPEIVPFSVGESAAPQIDRRMLDALPKDQQGKKELVRRARERQAQDQRAAEIPSEMEAAISESHLGTLVLAMWYDRNAQFVPGQMVANDASLVVPGGHDSAQAWEITPTGIRTLSPGDAPGSPSVRKRVPGGLKINLKKFDQVAAIILSSDPKLRDRLDAKIRQIAPEYARAAVDLAKAKLARVRIVDEELRALDVIQTDAPQILSAAQEHVELAKASLERNDYDSARLEAADAMQAMRILQRAHWNFALRLSSPVSSPYTVSFQTLPDHWRLLSNLGRMKTNAPTNVLVSGSFENQEAVVEEWFHSQNEVPGVRAAAELYPATRKGSHGIYTLRMVAVPATGVDTPTVISDSPVTVTTPAVPVAAGQLVHIAGWVRVSTPVRGSLDGLMVYDNLSGTVGAIRFKDKSNWQQFELVREVRESGEISLTMSLSGLGEVQIDDIRITPLDPRSSLADPAGKSGGATGGRDLLRFLNPWQNRRTRNDGK